MLFKSLFNFTALAGLASSASLKQVTSFGSNPTGLQMYIYVPDKLAAQPAVIVAVSRTMGRLVDFDRGAKIMGH
jgi:acetylxylan esterase